jgi:hypothetical protein
VASQLVQIISQRSDVQFIKVDFDANKQMCRTLGVKVLPFFHMYRGVDGRVAEFSASLSKIQRLRDALDEHGGARCNLEPSSPPALVRAFQLQRLLLPRTLHAPGVLTGCTTTCHPPPAAARAAALTLFIGGEQRFHLGAALRAELL